MPSFETVPTSDEKSSKSESDVEKLPIQENIELPPVMAEETGEASAEAHEALHSLDELSVKEQALGGIIEKIPGSKTNKALEKWKKILLATIAATVMSGAFSSKAFAAGEGVLDLEAATKFSQKADGTGGTQIATIGGMTFEGGKASGGMESPQAKKKIGDKVDGVEIKPLSGTKISTVSGPSFGAFGK